MQEQEHIITEQEMLRTLRIFSEDILHREDITAAETEIIIIKEAVLIKKSF